MGERRETFYDANSAKNKVEINLPIHALKGASFSVMLRRRNPSSSVFTGKRFDQDLRTEKSSSQCLTLSLRTCCKGGFTRTEEMLSFMPRYLRDQQHFTYFASDGVEFIHPVASLAE